nr:reverse transcriptase domain-containing protein [Tanacetum cinerariifolium]
MDSLSPQVVSGAKLPILNPNEFDLWMMRIEQYFLMTDYSLWEVILNGDSPVPTRLIEGVAQPVAPTTVEQKATSLDTFYNALNPNDQDALDSAAGGNFLDKIPRECLSIIKNKSKVRYSRSKVTDVRANANAPLSSSSHSNSFDLQQIAAALQDKLDIRMNRFEKSLNEMKNSFITPTTPHKVVTEVCVTCGSNRSYNQCPFTRGGNDFLVFHDNI